MKKLSHIIVGMPAWLSVQITLALVAAIGYVDYLTGDYSMLIFYAIPIALAAWWLGDFGTLFVSVAAGCARCVSDYFSYSGSKVSYLNCLEDTLYLLIVALIFLAVKRLFADRGERWAVHRTLPVERAPHVQLRTQR